MENIKMRIPTIVEWDKFMTICHDEDSKTHWNRVYSWINGPMQKNLMPSCGYYDSQCFYYFDKTSVEATLGFRPAFYEGLPLNIPEGESMVVGTLYMAGRPVRISDSITEYIPKAKLEMKPALADPDYQVQAIRVGDVYIANRVLLNWISYADIMAAITFCKMDIPTSREWDNMMDICKDDNNKTHWTDVFTWINNTDEYSEAESDFSEVRGYFSARICNYFPVSSPIPYVGFRPVFKDLNSDAQDGEIVVVGTLYMDGKPVKIPANPTYKGNITRYTYGPLEIRDALADPAYQVKAIKIGDTFIADRVLVSNISYEQIIQALN